ncbi:MAG: lamin tail domain-containing protein [Pedococcus sp.]
MPDRIVPRLTDRPTRRPWRRMQRGPARRPLAAALGLTCAAALLATGSVASAATTSKVWSAKVTYGTSDHTIDGDTVAVRVDGDSSSVVPPHIRNTGIQAMEIGSCHAAQATAAMDRMVAGRRVRLTTSATTTSSLGRPVRHLDVSTSNGWLDVQLSQLRAGHALPIILAGDNTRWKAYFTAAQQAAAARTNLWDTDYCRSGPSQSTPLKVWVNWDANGDDGANVNGEWVRVLNSSTTNLSVAGWQMRTGGQDSFTFPSTAIVPAGGLLTLRVGKGTPTSTTFYWGGTTPKFPNASVAANRHGSGAYLFDRDGDVRAWSIYPCLYACTSPLAGRVLINAQPDAPGVDADNLNGEYISLRPAGTSSIDLSYQTLSNNGYTWEIPRGTVVKPGEVYVLRVGKGTNSRLTNYWNSSKPILSNTGSFAELRTAEAVRIACKSWGTGRC